MGKFVRVDDWVPKKDDIKLKKDGKLVVIEFDKLFNNSGDALNNFIIKKESYYRNIDGVLKYINYFIKYYDTDNELLLAYLMLKYRIDDKSKDWSLDAFINMLYAIMFTDSMVAKINKMVEDNYYIDLSAKDTSRTYDPALEFTNEHGKAMMAMSMGIKMIIPIAMHYINSYGYAKNRSYPFIIYYGLFNLFGDNVNLLSKLDITITSKVNQIFTRNRVVINQREITGIDKHMKIDDLLKDKLVSETMFKYQFDKNIISFNHSILRGQLEYFLKEPYKHARVELSNEKDASGLSGVDKLEMNSTKIDESIVILSDINISHAIKMLERQTNIKVTNDEIDFYKNNMNNITQFQSSLVMYFFAKYFNGFRDLHMLTRRQYLKLLIIMKKRLQYQGFIYLPQLITANIEGKINNRTIRNNKFFQKIASSAIYEDLLTNKYSTLIERGNDNIVISILSKLINSKFSVVDYDNPDKLGEMIEVDADLLSDEYINFLDQI